MRLSTGPNPLDVPDPNGKPWPIHFNVYDLATQNAAKKNWTQEAIRKNRARGNLICGRPDPINRSARTTAGTSTRTSPSSGW